MIFAIKPFEIHDGDGIRTTVFFKGCPLRCKWCHNPESFRQTKEVLFDETLCKHCMKCVGLCEANRQADGKHVFDRRHCTECGACDGVCPHRALEVIGSDPTPEALATELLRDALFMKESGGGVTFSGGEPLLQIDACIALAKLLRREGINIAIDTSAYVQRETMERIIPYTDTFLFDVKAMDEEVHKRCTGVSNRQILENIRYADACGVPMDIRYPYVPTCNDGEAMAIARFVSTLRMAKTLRVLPYHDYAERKYACLGMQYPAADIPLPDRDALRILVKEMNRYTHTVMG